MSTEYQDAAAKAEFWRTQFLAADSNVAIYKLALTMIANGCDPESGWEQLSRMQMAQVAYEALHPKETA